MRGINTSKKSQMFRWRGVHEAHAAGAFFTRMEGKEHLAICPDCAVTESMEQIQLECEDGVHEIVWEIAKEIWEYAGERWPTLTYGLILRCGAAQSGASTEFRNWTEPPVPEAVIRGLVLDFRNKKRIEKEDDASYRPARQEVVSKCQRKIERAWRWLCNFFLPSSSQLRVILE